MDFNLITYLCFLTFTVSSSQIGKTCYLESMDGETKALKRTIDQLSQQMTNLQDQVRRQTQQFASLEQQKKTIAFYAIMTKDRDPKVNEKLIFNEVKTNVGNGYSATSGHFTAPRDGVYAFNWVIRMYKAEHSTQLIVNKQVFGATFLRAKNGDDGSVSKTAIARLSKGQVVYVRNHNSLKGDGIIHSNIHGQPSFSGWLIR